MEIIAREVTGPIKGSLGFASWAECYLYPRPFQVRRYDFARSIQDFVNSFIIRQQSPRCMRKFQAIPAALPAPAPTRATQARPIPQEQLVCTTPNTTMQKLQIRQVRCSHWLASSDLVLRIIRVPQTWTSHEARPIGRASKSFFGPVKFGETINSSRAEQVS